MMGCLSCCCRYRHGSIAYLFQQLHFFDFFFFVIMNGLFRMISSSLVLLIGVFWREIQEQNQDIHLFPEHKSPSPSYFKNNFSSQQDCLYKTFQRVLQGPLIFSGIQVHEAYSNSSFFLYHKIQTVELKDDSNMKFILILIFIITMGNQLCCHGFSTVQEGQELGSSFISSGPKLSDQIRQRLIELKPFQEEMPKRMRRIKYGQEIYEGEVNDRNKPEGYGKFYRSDGCLLMGKFTGGVIANNQKGYYFYPDGSYYYGEFQKNVATDKQGQVVNGSYKYIGGVKYNKFNGEGKEIHQDYQFQGIFKNNKRISGTLQWQQGGERYRYKGQFNDNEQFEGKGQLYEPTGTYVGEFKNGKKHGHGEYNFNNKQRLRYVGEYYNGLRHGKGTMYDSNNKSAYEGEWKNGLPNGKGIAHRSDGRKIKGQFLQGIDVKSMDKKLLEEKREELKYQ